MITGPFGPIGRGHQTLYSKEFRMNGKRRWGGAWGPNARAAQANALAMVTAGGIVELHCTG
jgi:hypothetical protein